MSTINTNYKANSVSAVDAGSDAGSNSDLKTRLEDAMRELEQYKAEYATSLSDESLREMERLEVMMKAEMAAIDAYGAGGVPGGASPAGTSWDAPTGLPAEWSVPEGYTLDITTNPDDAAICDDPSAYAGTINYETSRLNFSLQDDTIEKVDVVSKGKDLVLTVYHEDGTKESWVVKDGAVRSEPIIIDSTTMGHAVTIDASRAYRISDGKHGEPYGVVTGFQIWGSNFDDTIYGSQGADGIVGLAGGDKIDGGAGNDEIYGDDRYTTRGGYAGDVNGVTLTPENSRDDIRGGAGNDQIFGGFGIDTAYASDASDPVSWDMSNTVNDVSSAPDPDGWLDVDEDIWEWEEDDDGSIVLRNVGDEGGTIDIDMPEGYTMAMADVDSDDPDTLVITFVGTDEDGNPSTFKLKIDDFFGDTEGMDPASAVITLNIRGSEESDIIDFHKLMGPAALTSQNINIFGNGGNDIILGAESALVRDGIDTTDPLSSTVSDGNLNHVESQNVFYDKEDKDGYISDVVDGQIVIKDNPDPEADPTSDDRVCRVIAPEGFDRGYITVGEDGYTYVILVNDEGDTMVFKFEDTNLNYTNISVLDRRPGDDDDGSVAKQIPIIPISFDNMTDEDADGNPDWNMLSGGEGADVIFGNKNSTFDEDSEEDFIVKGSFETEESHGTEVPETPDPADEPPEDPPPDED